MDIQEDHTGGRRQISLGCGAGPSHHVCFVSFCFANVRARIACINWRPVLSVL